MKITLLYTVFIGLLLNGALISANDENEQNSPVTAVLESVPDAATPILPLAHTYAHVATSVPFLVPFNKALFDEYCMHMAKFYANKQSVLPYIIPVISVVAGPFALYEGYNLTTKAFGGLQTTVKEFDGIGSGASAVMRGGYCAFRIHSMVSLALATGAGALFLYQSIKALSKNGPSNNALELSWQERMSAPTQEQEKQWHTLIYERFGKPIVVDKSATGEQARTVLAFQKKNGIQYDVRFNPYDQEQVRILLGVHPKVHDDLQCEQIEIISIPTA
jgi:hypothetical protein